MSVESLIFIAIFIVLPLIERLLKAKRGGNEKPQAPPPPRPMPRERVPLPPRHRTDVPELPVPGPTAEVPMPRPVPTATEPAARREAPPVRLPQPVESGPTRRRMPESGPRAKTELPRRRPPAPVPVPVPQPPVTRPPAAEERPRRLPVEARSLESLEDEVTRYQRRAAKAAATKIPAPVQQQRRTARAVRRILMNRTSLRRAVIVATVIGPCKANEQT